MSRSNLWQNCHKNKLGNKLLTDTLVQAIRGHELTSKQVASDIDVSTERVRNWFYRNTGMTALDLLLLMGEYEFVRQFITLLLLEYQQGGNCHQMVAIYIEKNE
ncbi:hypothetical protein [Oleidesulfovibrio alaskensis]|uniref:hypothetical protein n=1 Tax=Oleidesulfovibrio alaskensis TaxID=58180 RepID=UPI000480EBE7|nr:hypothetical protein [Oleidesulfovibrio alaskensis]